MPYINIKITDEQVTKEQKAQLIAGATQLLVDVLGKNPKTTVVVIDEVKKILSACFALPSKYAHTSLEAYLMSTSCFGGRGGNEKKSSKQSQEG